MFQRKKITFATFNLYNLNEANLPLYRNNDGWTSVEYAKKIDWSASILKNFKSNVWGFQELWHEDSLKAIFKKAKLLDEYELLVPKDHSGKFIVCAGAVKKEILEGEPEWIVRFPEKFLLKNSGEDNQTPEISVNIDAFSRPVLRFKIKPRTNGKAITVFVAHLKSKRPAAVYKENWYNQDKEFYKNHTENLGYALSTIRRTAEASALRMLITNEAKHNDTPIVVLGDLNDDQLSNTLNILTGQPNYLLNSYSAGGSDVDLYSVSTLQELRSLRDVYYTHTYQNIKQSLDHILVSQEFYDNSKKRLWSFKGAQLCNDHIDTNNHKDKGTSDHGIVKATFEYRPI